MKQLNTSVRLTYKNGRTEEYASIEEASENSGLSVQAIKIRANKNTTPKDGISCEWLDEHTKRSYRAKKSKVKGKALEYEIRDQLRAIGYVGCERSAGQSRSLDADKVDICDVEGKLPVNIQAKNYANTPSYFNIREQCSDKSKPFCLCWKKNTLTTDNTVFIIPDYFFYQLLDAYTKQNHIL